MGRVGTCHGQPDWGLPQPSTTLHSEICSKPFPKSDLRLPGLTFTHPCEEGTQEQTHVSPDSTSSCFPSLGGLVMLLPLSLSCHLMAEVSRRKSKAVPDGRKAQQSRTTVPQSLNCCKPNPPFLEKCNSSSSVFLGAGEQQEQSASIGSLGRGSAILQSASILVSAMSWSKLEVMAAASYRMPRRTLRPAQSDFRGCLCLAWGMPASTGHCSSNPTKS